MDSRISIGDKAHFSKTGEDSLIICNGLSRRAVYGSLYRSRRMKRRAHSGAAGARRSLPTPLYSLAMHIAFEYEVLGAIEASDSDLELDSRVSRIVEEEPTPMVCGKSVRGKPHRHNLKHTHSPHNRRRVAPSPRPFSERSTANGFSGGSLEFPNGRRDSSPAPQGFSPLNFAQSLYPSLYAGSSSSSALASFWSAVSKPSMNQL